MIKNLKLTDEQITIEINKLRLNYPGLSEEAYEMIAWTTIANSATLSEESLGIK